MTETLDRAASIRGALLHALHNFEGAPDRWLPLQRAGASDEQILERIRFEFGIYGGATYPVWHEFWGGQTPRLTVAGTHLHGRRLISAVREALQISPPMVDAEGQLSLDLFTAAERD